MKKIIVIVVVVAVVVIAVDFIAPALKERAANKSAEQNSAASAASSADAPRGPGMGGPGGGRRGNPMDALKNEEGKIDLSKLADSRMPDQMKEALQQADADGDGLLNDEEREAAEVKMREMRNPLNQLKNEEGKIDLSKLADARMPDPMKEAIQKADADADGFLSEEEVKAFLESMPRGPRMGGGRPGSGAPAPSDAPAPPAEEATPEAPAATDAPAAPETASASETPAPEAPVAE